MNDIDNRFNNRNNIDRLFNWKKDNKTMTRIWSFNNMCNVRMYDRQGLENEQTDMFLPRDMKPVRIYNIM